MQDTISWIESNGWQYCGAGDNLEQARQPSILQYGETRIVLLSYNERPPIEFYATYTTAGTAPLSLDVVKEDILKYRQPGTVIIVNPHWGIEMTTVPRRDQRKTARAILDMGADAVIGQHPHCPQGVELYKGKPIFYSIGNFITGFSYPSQMDNMAVALYINENAQIIRIEIIPVNGKNKEIMHSVSLLSGNRAKRLLNNVEDLSRDFGVKIVRNQNRGFIELKKLVIASTKTKGD
jgi:poly-gamma-glutamate synthesis protein (capsule biosynthesis protein)